MGSLPAASARSVKVALVFPPSADPTAPYLSLPTLAAWLRQHEVRVLPIDANLEAWEHVLREDVLRGLGDRVLARIADLEAKPRLSHQDALLHAALFGARAEAAYVPAAIAGALAVLRDRSGERFYDPAEYESAVATVEAAQRLVSAAHAPLAVDFVVMVANRACDVGILFSSDTDLVPALEAVLALRPQDPPACEVAAWVVPGVRPRSLSVRAVRVRRHLLTEVEYRSVADLTDYTRPS